MSHEDFQFILPSEDHDHSEPPIGFQSIEIEYELTNSLAISQWIESIITQEQCVLSRLSFTFCSDQYLHKINIDYLDHDTFTDIITFPYADLPKIEGEIFISIDRIKENAEALDTTFQNELHRVIIHGVLHLCGYGDKKQEEKKLMTQKENEALSQFPADQK